MPRPKKCRQIGNYPLISIFKPMGKGLPELEPVVLSIEELEALRLADLEGKKQEEAAQLMNVSRATFGRIIERARCVVADALVNGKAIVIEGGNFCHRTLAETLNSDECFHEKQKKCLNCPKYISLVINELDEI